MMSACNPDRLPAGSGSAATSATWARRRDQAAAARDRVDGAAGALGWAVMAPSDKYHRLGVSSNKQVLIVHITGLLHLAYRQGMLRVSMLLSIVDSAGVCRSCVLMRVACVCRSRVSRV